jgi:hypothetical protein
LGTDRTGVFIATYRIAFDAWTPEQALQEMRSFHFKGFWHPAMKVYIRGFPARLAHSPALASFRQTGLTKNDAHRNSRKSGNAIRSSLPGIPDQSSRTLWSIGDPELPAHGIHRLGIAR